MPRTARLRWMDAAERAACSTPDPERAAMIRRAFKNLAKQTQLHAYRCPVCNADVIYSVSYTAMCLAHFKGTPHLRTLRCGECKKTRAKNRGWTARARAVVAEFREMYQTACREAAEREAAWIKQEGV